MKQNTSGLPRNLGKSKPVPVIEKKQLSPALKKGLMIGGGIAAFIVLFLIFIMPILGNYAEFSGGFGTGLYPYRITAPEQLTNMRNHLSASYVLVNDIQVPEEAVLTPIGNEETPFTGYLNGNRKTITGLNPEEAVINETTNVMGNGLFGKNKGTLEGLTFSVDITKEIGLQNNQVLLAGILVGLNEGNIKNCRVTGSMNYMVIGMLHLGGLAGGNGANGIISECTDNVNIIGYANSSLLIGGVVGYNAGILDRCGNEGNVRSDLALLSTNDYVGGIAGSNNKGYIKNCFNAGVINANTFSAGIAALNTGIIANSYNAAQISVGDTTAGGAGGIAGYVMGSEDAFVTNCFNTGLIVGTRSGGVAAVVSIDLTAAIGNCYYLSTSSLRGVFEGISATVITPKTQEQMQSNEFINLLNTNRTALSTWKSGGEGQYPLMSWQ